jgi:N-acetylglucosamine-6-sulfatase
MTDLVGNIDIAPTLLEAAGVSPQKAMDGQSFWKSLCGSSGAAPPRDELLYEYYWERNYPHTPTLHAIIGGRYKYIRCHGLWDRDELYDLESDPDEMQNLIDAPEHAKRIQLLNARLWKLIQDSGGNDMPLMIDHGPVFPMRDPAKSGQAPFPDEYFN